MKFFPLVLLAVFSLASAQRTYNITSALEDCNWDKYKCLTTATWLPQIPECLRNCTIEANQLDGCAYDDFACHCINYQKYSDVVEPCALPPEFGGRGGGCDAAELSVAQPLVTDMCNFFNATLYAGYAVCPRRIRLSPLTTLGIVFGEETVQVE
ncbi:hypothetical protein K458DRAFT_340235 [Lentithecium fluviatile CBS 122367]|uniref:CFEM domain-containing protein n=1 Tax=Lentithecium fluviatile CBS 122367 TaxID=1168545 RepID=A0A6G1IYF6_9PLEO|nr:hypothetical protein K458DRAFT_340235 [Lentithecium fluviatile CBS 122367]